MNHEGQNQPFPDECIEFVHVARETGRAGKPAARLERPRLTAIMEDSITAMYARLEAGQPAGLPTSSPIQDPKRDFS